jgi:hypothetical protein
MRKKIAQLTRPTDISSNNLSIVIQSIHDKLNELITAVNTAGDKATPEAFEGEDGAIKVIDDQTDGTVKIGVKSRGSWHTTDTTGG